MIYEYEFEDLNDILKGIIRKNLTPEAWGWLEKEGESIAAKGEVAKFNIAFVAMPRKTGKNPVTLSRSEADTLRKFRNGFQIEGWTIDRLCRVWLLMQVNPRPKEKYTPVIENLFLNAEMSELVALYSALPLLACPEAWRKRCAEGIRSNIGQVLEAIICNNPYPSEQLDESAWNQLVLKAIFTDKPLLEITGADKRHNRKLTDSLCDYAHERWAARRTVNPLLWMFVGPYIHSGNFSDIQRVFNSEDPLDREAAALACHASTYEGAKQLLQKDPELKRNIENRNVTWRNIAQRMQ